MPPAWLPRPTLVWPTPDQAKESVRRLIQPLLATSLLVTGTVLGLRYWGWLEFAELTAYDHLMQQRVDQGPDDRILVVGINETDLQTLQEWPISDQSLATALTALQRYGPAVIAVDILRDFPQGPGHDDFIQLFRQHPTLLATCKTSSPTDLGTPPPSEVEAEQVAFADLVVDPGGILRRSLLLVTPPQPDRPFPKQHHCNNPNHTLLSFAFRSTLIYLQAQGLEASFTETGELILGDRPIPRIDPNIGGYRNADTAGYQILLNYRSEHKAAPQVSLLDVLEGRVGPEQVQGRIIMLGYTTPQSKDDFYTPFSSARSDQQKMPGVVIHAQAASQLLGAVLDGDPLLWAWPLSMELLWIVAWSILGGVLSWYLRHPAAFALVVVLGVGGIYTTSLVFFAQSGWVPMVPPVLTFLGTAVGVVLLDRFNNSAYGQQVYRKVKTLLHVEIDIDEEKLEEQVAEITETDYFRDLQAKVKALREQADSDAPRRRSSAPAWPGKDTPSPKTSASLSESLPQDGLDALDHLFASESPRSHPASEIHSASEDFDFLDGFTQALPSPTPPAEIKEEEDDDGLDFLNDINRDAQRLKQAHKADTPVYCPFTLEEAFCGCNDTSEATRHYVACLNQDIKALKQADGPQPLIGPPADDDR